MTQELGPRLARGRTADIHAWGDGQVLKLFLDWRPASSIEREYQISRALYQAGVPVPDVGDVVEVDGRRGIVFERLDGPSMLRHGTSRPWTIRSMARRLAELHVAVHGHSVPGLPSQAERIRNRISGAQGVDEETRATALDVLSRLPVGNSLCHGDFHPDNIMMTARGPIIIDWMDASLGDPLADVAATSLLLRLGQPPPGTPGRLVIEAGRRLVHWLYLRRYRQLRGVPDAGITAWLLPLAVARLGDEIPGEGTGLQAIIDESMARLG